MQVYWNKIDFTNVLGIEFSFSSLLSVKT
jgi:hypothetical protein